MECTSLNEDQATLLITFLRNSDIVHDFKYRLVKAFRALVNQAKTPMSQIDVLVESHPSGSPLFFVYTIRWHRQQPSQPLTKPVTATTFNEWNQARSPLPG